MSHPILTRLVRKGVKPSAARLIGFRSSCRQFVEEVQTDTTPALARDATGLSTPNLPASNPTESKEAGVRLPSSADAVGRVAEEQVQQGNVELKDSLLEIGIAWSSATFLVAVIAVAVLLGIVTRNTRQRTVAVSAAIELVPERNLEGEAGKGPPETTIGKTSEVVTPINSTLPDRLIHHLMKMGKVRRSRRATTPPALAQTKKSSPILS
jgi:hypothetical protein